MQQVTFDFEGLLKSLTGISNWHEETSLDTCSGIEYAFSNGNSEAWIVIDQYALSVKCDGEIIFFTDNYEEDPYARTFITIEE